MGWPFLWLGAVEGVGDTQTRIAESPKSICSSMLMRCTRARQFLYVHPYDNQDVILGQGTIGLELLEKIPDLDCLIIPIGGGGLISGIAVAAKSINPKIKEAIDETCRRVKDWHIKQMIN